MVIATMSSKFARLRVRSPSLRAAILKQRYLEERACD